MQTVCANVWAETLYPVADMKNTKTLAVNSLICAMCVVIMALCAVIETLDISLAVIAGILVGVSEIEYGKKWAWLVFAVSSVLSLLLPQKSAGFFFILIAGWYPIVQTKINMLKPVISRIVKTLIINISMAIAILLTVFVFKTEVLGYKIIAALVLLGNITFILYDKLLDRLMLWYIVKLRNRLGFK